MSAEKRKTLGLALGSGGARGVAHIGFLAALEEAGIKPDYIAGCSMGAVIGGCYASGMSVSRIKELALGLRTRDIIDFTPGFITRMSLLRSKKIEVLLTDNIGDVKIEDMQIPFRCVATDLYNSKLHVFESGDAALAIRASSAIPGVFRPVKTDGMFLVDGGCLCRVPVKQVKEMGADVVVAVDVLINASKPTEKVGNLVSLLLRVFDVMDSHNTSLQRIIEGDLCDLLLEPEMEGLSQYEIKGLDIAYNEGYETGKANIEKIKELLD